MNNVVLVLDANKNKRRSGWAGGSLNDKANSFVGDEDFLDMVDEPLGEAFNFVYGDFHLVGHGDVTTAKCGSFGAYYGCIRVDLHDVATLDGVNYKDKVYIRPYFHSCDKPSCPICFKVGWAVRMASRAEVRLVEAHKRGFGEIEHIIASVPLKDYNITYKTMKRHLRKALEVRGVVGGAIIFHGARYASPEEARRKKVISGWRWSPHFHILGFIVGGYSRCRKCSRRMNCLKGCDEFYDRTYQHFLKDGYYVKVMGKRKTIGGTVWYQLSHATYKEGRGRPHIITWFGTCSRRRLKVTIELKKRVCPICESKLVKLNYFGSDKICLDRSSPNFKRELYRDFREGDSGIFYGAEVWAEAHSSRY